MTSTETRTSWSDRLSPRNWSLAWKLAAVGLVPALLAIVLGVLRVADQADTASDLGVANRVLEVRGHVADAASTLRVERDRATSFLAERRLGDRAPLQEAIRNSDAALEQIRTALPAAGTLDATTRVAVEQAQGGFAQLPVLRDQINGTDDLPAADVTQRYTGLIARADMLDRALLRQVPIPGVGGMIDALSAVTAASEAIALQHTVLGAALRAGTVTPADRANVNATDNALAAAYAEYQVALPTTQTPINFVTSRANAERDTDKVTILSAPTPGPISVTVAEWDDVTQRAQEQVNAAGTQVRTALTAAGQGAEARSSNLAGVNSVLLMLGLLLAATIVVLVARTLTRSLRVLRSSALEVAQRRLPQAVESMRAGTTPDVTVEPVPLTNRDEVGQVARAFDAVHGQALRLAADQAALQSNVSSMFVNLSRRSQGLVERQLQLIEQLESNEQDPDQLSNLFQLDHLATRMRRNSENLLVLAGTDFAKRNVAPVPLVDVLRAAVSEIEHYQRITVQAPPAATVVGRATSDVVHLLAELLDNAANFSPPDSQVVMSSTRMADGAILVEIADLGVGMLENELTDANQRLTTPSAVDVSASRRMGLFVVGRLGARHGITVHLGGAPRGGPGGGVTASVTLPAHLVASAGDGGGRQPRADSPLAAAPPNGVPPQRIGQAGSLGQPGRTPRASLAAPANGQAPAQLTALNGLPTRTPGSSLRRDPEPVAAAEVADPATTEQPITPNRRGDQPGPRRDQQGPLWPGNPQGPQRLDDQGPRPGEPDQEPRRPGAGAAALAGGAAALAGVAAALAGAAAARRGGPAADDTLDTPPNGHRGDAQRSAARDDDAAVARDGSDDAADATARDTINRGTPDDVPADDAALESTESDTSESPEHEDLEHENSEHDDPERDALADDDPERDASADDDREYADLEYADLEYADAESDAAGSEVTALYGEPADGRAADGVAADAGDRTDGEEPSTTAVDEAAGAAGDTAGPALRPAPRPRPTARPVPNGTFRDRAVPATSYGPIDNGPQNGVANGTGPHGAEDHDAERDGGPSRTTTPLPVVAGPDQAGDSRAYAAPVGFAPPNDHGADALFAPSVPAISEPEGLPRTRRPLAEVRGSDDADLTETTPIFEEIASAWFADERPVPVDWELGHRPGAEAEKDLDDAPPPPPPLAAPVPSPSSATEGWGAGTPVPAAGSAAPAEAASEALSGAPSGQEFATAADEGWRAASGAAAERPDELTAAGLPKRRPRARLVPGSAGSAVLAAAPAAPTRSAENVRGRLASYQQGVRQGREIRLRRDPGSTGSEPAPTGENPAASTGGEYDEENR